MIVTEEKVKKHHEGLVKLFKRFNIDAAVNAKNVQNAMNGIPAFKNTLQNTYKSFEGSSEHRQGTDPDKEVDDFANEGKEGASKEVEDDFDELTGEKIKKKKKKVLQNAMELINRNGGEENFSTGDAIKIINATAKKETPEEKKAKEIEVEKAKKIDQNKGKIFGIDSTIFWGIAIVLMLIAILWIVKAVK